MHMLPGTDCQDVDSSSFASIKLPQHELELETLSTSWRGCKRTPEL